MAQGRAHSHPFQAQAALALLPTPIKMQQILALVLCFVSALAIRQGELQRQEPKGAGHPEPTMQLACAECSKHAPYLADCTCFATDIMGTFEDDATKTLTTRKEFTTETVNTGAKRLAEGWMWHCRPVSGTPDLWKQC
uniref:Uncharacterized protein n=1 Tax=Alexandrium andersonii TaxID=327968 RepID=A0A7S2G9G2_9DINO